MTKNSDDRKVYYLTGKLMQIAIFVFIGIVITMSIIQEYFGVLIVDKTSGDISSWVALVVSIGIGVFISLAILIYSKFEQEKISQIVFDVKKITTKLEDLAGGEEKLRKRRKKYALVALMSTLAVARRSLGLIGKGLEEYDIKDSKGNFKTKINERSIAEESLAELGDIINQYNDILEPNLINEVNNVYYSSDKGKKLDETKFLISRIDDALEMINLSKS